MTRIFEDLVEGGAAQLSISGGWTANRVFYAAEVESTADATAYQAVLNGAIPAPGTPHPTIPQILVDNIAATVSGSRQVTMVVNYKGVNGTNSNPDDEAQTQISINGSIQTVRTNERVIKKGNKEEKELIKLKYVYPDDKHPKGLPNGTVNEVVGTVEKQVPVIVATLSRRETKDPAQKAFDNVGKLNSKIFIGGEPGLWMCTKIGGTSSDSGQTYAVTYEFMRADEGWFATLFFADEKTGKIPADVEEQEDAQAKVISQFSADFNLLKLGPFSKK